VKRRDFITLLGGAVATWPLAASAQEPGRTYRLGSVQPNPRNGPHFVAFFDELRRLGFMEGQNLTVDGRGYGLHIDQFAEIAAEMVRAKVDVILCAGDVATRAAQQATTSIPIVAVTDDMVASGLVSSLAKPGGNTTGVSIFATELDGKRQELLIEALPGLRRMAALADTTQPLRGALQDEHTHAGSSSSSNRSPGPRRLYPQSMLRRLRVPQRLTCWRRRSSSSIAGSYTNAPPRCTCLRYTNFRKWQRRVVSSRTARA
jgi:putative ABC transport system substrate-binding protein